MDTEDKVEYELEVVLKDAETLAILCDGGYRLAVGLPRTEDTHFRTENDRLKITSITRDIPLVRLPFSAPKPIPMEYWIKHIPTENKRLEYDPVLVSPGQCYTLKDGQVTITDPGWVSSDGQIGIENDADIYPVIYRRDPPPEPRCIKAADLWKKNDQPLWVPGTGILRIPHPANKIYAWFVSEKAGDADDQDHLGYFDQTPEFLTPTWRKNADGVYKCTIYYDHGKGKGFTKCPTATLTERSKY